MFKKKKKEMVLDEHVGAVRRIASIFHLQL